MRLPIGISDFREVIEGHFEFIDKSLFIQDIIEDTKVTLITRPRRFGKTLNLSMLKYFFSDDENNNSNRDLFRNLKISEASNDILKHQGKYPVVFLSLKDIKEDNFSNFKESFSRLISKLYSDHYYILSGKVLHDSEKNIFENILNRIATETDLKSSLADLSEYLARHHRVNPILLIDEYDTPIQHARMMGYYNETISFFRLFLGTALKDNSFIHKAVLTGILRISKESLFSEVNNIKVYTSLHSRYSEYFGFTEKEVLHLLEKNNMQENFDSVRTWYNGYQFGNVTIYNPWSIINYIVDGGALQPYWVNTSDNTLIRELILHASFDFKSQIERLLQSNTFETIIDEHVVFQFLNSNETAIWTLFLMAGYLTVLQKRETDQGLMCLLAIPNREVRNLYRRIIETWLSDGRAVNWYNQFLHELLDGHVDRAQKYLNDILLQIASAHDMAREPEAFYHGLMLGLTASIQNEYEVKSNRESGFGFYDIIILPKDIRKLGIVIELKHSENHALEETAKAALKQIQDKQYSIELKTRGIQKILNLGISFSGKKLHIASAEY